MAAIFRTGRAFHDDDARVVTSDDLVGEFSGLIEFESAWELGSDNIVIGLVVLVIVGHSV